MNPSQDIIRDSEYYNPTGDCTILVENILFRVHKIMLSRDRSVFVDMFNLPSGSDSTSLQNSTRDEDPLILHDTANQFRALCWIIHALPLETERQYNANSVNISRLIDLSSIAHKYQFSTTEQWCNGVLLHHCRSGIGFLTNCSALDFEALASIAFRAEATDLADVVQSSWLSRLQSGTLPASHALAIGEKYSWRNFLGKVYYQQLCKLRTAHLAGDPRPIDLNGTDFTVEQKYHLLHGFYSISVVWDAFESKRAFEGICPSGTLHQHLCAPQVPALWSFIKAFRVRNGWDPLGDLAFSAKQIPTANLIMACKKEISQKVQTMHDDMLRDMADHFLGPSRIHECR